MKFNILLALIFAIGILSGCSSMKVTSEQDETFDVGKTRTYQWVDGPEEILNEADTYLNEDIKKALNDELTRRGLRQVTDTAGADVQMAYYIKLKEAFEYTDSTHRNEHDFSGGFVYNRESSSWNYAAREPDLNVYTAETGTLTVLIYDTATGKRIWRGNLKTSIDRSRPEEKQQARILGAAKKLVAHSPLN